jgi:transcriptional regulator with XRE-family HTH domain
VEIEADVPYVVHGKEVLPMNQEKIGRFIASCRKEQGLTQARLAERLGITDRAVSKWENGKSLPDASIMLELCDLLKITVNELLSGERLDMDDYRKMAEENIVPSMKAVVIAPHIGRSRRMRCPHCGNVNYHKKTLSKRA